MNLSGSYGSYKHFFHALVTSRSFLYTNFLLLYIFSWQIVEFSFKCSGFHPCWDFDVLVVSISIGEFLFSFAKPFFRFERDNKVKCINVCIWLTSLILLLFCFCFFFFSLFPPVHVSYDECKVNSPIYIMYVPRNHLQFVKIVDFFLLES